MQANAKAAAQKAPVLQKGVANVSKLAVKPITQPVVTPCMRQQYSELMHVDKARLVWEAEHCAAPISKLDQLQGVLNDVSK